MTTLLLSDLHLGRGTPGQSRAAERDAVALVRAHADALLAPGAALVLLGDVFHTYLEYRHAVPRAAPRLVGLLAELADAGAAVRYVVGNRDPWHAGFFEDEIGLTLQRRPAVVRLSGHAVYLAHGDEASPADGRAARALSRTKLLLRAPAMARLYRTCLPGDAGLALAAWVSRRFGTDGAADPAEVARVRARAAHALAGFGAEVAALGHSHAAALDALPGGLFLNPGYWFADRTFGRLEPGRAALARWADGRAHPLAEQPLAAPAARPPAVPFAEDARAAAHPAPAPARSL